MLWNNITVVFTELNVSLSNTEWLPSKHELLIEFDLLSHPFAIHINCLSHVCFPCVWLWLSTLVILRNWKPVLLCCAVPLTIVPEKAHGWLLVILYQLKKKNLTLKRTCCDFMEIMLFWYQKFINLKVVCNYNMLYKLLQFLPTYWWTSHWK